MFRYNAVHPLPGNHSHRQTTNHHNSGEKVHRFLECPNNEASDSNISMSESQVDFIQTLKNQASKGGGRIVFAEGEDPRVVEAALALSRHAWCQVSLVCPEAKRNDNHRILREVLGVELVDPETDCRKARLTKILLERRRHKGMTLEEASKLVPDPLYFAALMVSAGYAHGTIGGAVRTTADTLRAALHCIGPAQNSHGTVSSAVVLVHPDPRFGNNGVMVFADCAMIPDPDPTQLSNIAMSSARTYSSLVGYKPRVAMLSFSTKGSGKHPMVDKVREATALLESRGVAFDFDGEVQLDAALVPRVCKQKAKGSPLNGHANVFVFPDLNSGNITYKAVQRFAGALGVGPITQGLAKPANDLSRGCSSSDIVLSAYITMIQAKQDRG